MTDSHSGKSKAAKWLPALIAALVLVALAAWWFNRSQDAAEDSAAMAADPTSQMDASGAQTGQPAVPEGTNAAALAGGDRGNASAIENADRMATEPVPGADPLNDGVAGRGPGAAPAPSPAATPTPGAPPAGQ